MEKSSKTNKKLPDFLLVLVIISFLLAGGLALYFLKAINVKTFKLEGNYYGFEIKTPKNWIAEKNTLYQEQTVSELVDLCRKDSSGDVYKIGNFRLLDQKYTDDVSSLPENSPTGAVLEVSINCVASPDLLSFAYGDLKIAGENAQKFSDYFTFIHNGLQYKINQYIHIAKEDKPSEERIKKDYTNIIEKIISSFKFTK